MRNKPKVYVSPSERMVHGCAEEEYGMSMYILYKHTTKTQTQYIFFSLLSISFDYVHFRNEYVGKNVLLRNENNFVGSKTISVHYPGPGTELYCSLKLKANIPSTLRFEARKTVNLFGEVKYFLLLMLLKLLLTLDEHCRNMNGSPESQSQQPQFSFHVFCHIQIIIIFVLMIIFRP